MELDLNYVVENYSSRYILDTKTDNEEKVIFHRFDYEPAINRANGDTYIYEVDWDNYTTQSPKVKTGGKIKREKEQWVIKDLVVKDPTTAAGDSQPGPNQKVANSKSDVLLEITTTNLYGTSKSKIGIDNSATNGFNNTDSTFLPNTNVYRFIYDKKTVDIFNSISSSMQKVPTNFDPFYGTPTNPALSAYDSFGNTGNLTSAAKTNNDQLSMWDGFFWGRDGWQDATEITTANCSQWDIPTTYPTFVGNDADYKWVIFKYTYNNPGAVARAYYNIVVKFQGSEFSYNDIKNDNLAVFFWNQGIPIGGADGQNYHWINISNSTTQYSAGTASSGNMSSYSGTTGIQPFTNPGNFETAGYSIYGETGARTISAYINKSTIPSGSSKTFYIAIGIKNNLNPAGREVKIKKPSEIRLKEAAISGGGFTI